MPDLRDTLQQFGTGPGAHLVALVGTAERYLRGAGLSFANVRGVIPIDGAAYDIAATPVVDHWLGHIFG